MDNNKFNEILKDIIKNKNNVYIQDLSNKIKINMEKAYWDKIYEDMMNGNSISFGSLLEEISDKIIKLVPNNKRFINNFKEELNIYDIKIKIDDQNFMEEDFIICFKYIVNIISKLQSQSDDIKLENFKNDMLANIENDCYIHYIKEIFLFLNNHLDNIYVNKLRYCSY